MRLHSWYVNKASLRQHYKTNKHIEHTKRIQKSEFVSNLRDAEAITFDFW